MFEQVVKVEHVRESGLGLVDVWMDGWIRGWVWVVPGGWRLAWSCVRQPHSDSDWQPSRWRDETILFVLPS